MPCTCGTSTNAIDESRECKKPRFPVPSSSPRASNPVIDSLSLPIARRSLSGCVVALVSTMASNGAQFTREQMTLLSRSLSRGQLIGSFSTRGDVKYSPAVEQYLNFYGCIAAGKPGKSIAPTIILYAGLFESLLLGRSETTS